MVRVGIRTKGCSGQQYDLQYTTKKEKFDEEIKQDGKWPSTPTYEDREWAYGRKNNVSREGQETDIKTYLFVLSVLGVTVLVDNKALLSVLGSEMDYVEDKLSAQFVFNNPNVKESCGCGQSFMT